jgi:hypothetical protein
VNYWIIATAIIKVIFADRHAMIAIQLNNELVISRNKAFNCALKNHTGEKSGQKRLLLKAGGYGPAGHV